MSNRSIPAAPAVAGLAATIITTIAATAALAGWSRDEIAAPLIEASVAAWVVFAITAWSTRLLTEVRHIATDMTKTLEDYGQEQYSDGVNAGIRRAMADPPPHTSAVPLRRR